MPSVIYLYVLKNVRDFTFFAAGTSDEIDYWLETSPLADRIVIVELYHIDDDENPMPANRWTIEQWRALAQKSE